MQKIVSETEEEGSEQMRSMCSYDSAETDGKSSNRELKRVPTPRKNLQEVQDRDARITESLSSTARAPIILQDSQEVESHMYMQAYEVENNRYMQVEPQEEEISSMPIQAES